MNRRFTAFMASLVLAGSVCVAGAGPASAASGTGVGAWTPTSNGLSLVRYSFRATTLLDGRVLVEGGFAPGSYTPEAEMYDPATNAWTVVSPMHQGRGEQTATLLKDGRVLVAGGYAGPVLSSAEIFDPSTGQWQVTGSMHINRTRQAAVRLCDGRVLVVGGWNGQNISSAEIYDPSTGLWTLTPGSLPEPTTNLEAFLLPDCTVLVAGGAAGAGGGTPSAAAYIFHPDTGTFTATASMHYARSGFSGAQLSDGRVLVMGGNTASSSTTAEVYDPATGQWSDVAPMNDPHTLGQGEEAQTLPDGRVLVPGDTANGLEAELYDPAANTWSFTGPQNTAHDGGVTALLSDGHVLNAGGRDSAGTLTPVAETYDPLSQVISFTGPAKGTYGGSATLSATGGGSGNPVVFTADPSSTVGACAVSGTNGSKVAYTGTGNCVIDANQAGGNGYNSAHQVQQTIKVSPAPLTITAASLTMTLGGEPPVITPSYSGFVAGDSPASLTTQATCSTTASSTSPLGFSLPSTCTGAADPDYLISYVPGRVSVILGNYVSMGDSFSSGEGDGSYIGDNNTFKCHRSLNSYPALLVNADPLSLLDHPTYAACTGAETNDFINPNHQFPTIPAQVSELDKATNVVTFTIGGNDTGFAYVLQKCAHYVVPGKRNYGFGCSKNKAFVNLVNKRIAALEGLGKATAPSRNFFSSGKPIIPIQQLLTQAHNHAPQASIFVAGYPHLFGSSTKYFATDPTAPSHYICQMGTFPTPLSAPITIDYADAQWLNSESDALDHAIAAAVSKARASDAHLRVTYVNTVPDLFATHGLCDSSGVSWFNPVSVDLFTQTADPGSLHPNKTGQMDGYEAAFAGM